MNIIDYLQPEFEHITHSFESKKPSEFTKSEKEWLINTNGTKKKQLSHTKQGTEQI